MKASEIPWQLVVLVLAALVALIIILLGPMGYKIEGIGDGKSLAMSKSEVVLTKEDIDLHVQAQAMCVGIASAPTNESLITAVSRPRINVAGNPVSGTENKGIVSCDAICGTVPNREGVTGTLSCFGGVHLYAPNTNELKNKFGAAMPYQAYLYNATRCDVDWSGPNYCCCGSRLFFRISG